MGSMKFNSWLSGGSYDEIDPNLDTRGESAHNLMFLSSFILAHINKTIDYRSRRQASKNLLPREQIEAVAASIKETLDDDPIALDPWCRDSDLPMLRFFERVGSNTGANWDELLLAHIGQEWSLLLFWILCKWIVREIFLKAGAFESPWMRLDDPSWVNWRFFFGKQYPESATYNIHCVNGQWCILAPTWK